MPKQIAVAILGLILMPFFGWAQFYLSGQDPASLRWNQIRTTHFRLIFPENYNHQARHLANLFEVAYPAVRFDLDAPALRTDVIVHNRSVVSNATVAWAPRRVNIFHTPPQDGYAQPWYNQLAVHELRHVAQLSKINTGFTRVLRYAFGEQVVAGIFGLYLPFYFVEGDAVVAETALGNSGRGRQPLFEAGLRAQLLEIGYYLHDKAYFGSYKHHTPNVYELGYFVVGHNKVKFGPILWENATRKVAHKPWMIFPYSHGLKQMSGFGKNRLYRETMYDLYEIWKAQHDTLNYTSSAQISPQRKNYTQYRYPQPLADGSVIAIRSSIDDIVRIVKLNENGEEILFTPGSTFRETLTATDSLVVWSEFQPDLRWANQNFAVIKIGELGSGLVRQLAHKSRFLAPDLTPDNKKIVVVETDIDSRNYIVVLDAHHGEELFRYGSDDLFFQIPLWMPDQINVVVVVVTKEGKSVYRINTITSEIEQLIPFTYDDIAPSSVTDDYYFFAGPWSGISNIYAYSFSDGGIYQLTSSKFGATDAVLDGNKLIYADYNSRGYHLAEALIDDMLWLPLSQVQNHAYKLADKLSQMSILNIDETDIPDSLYSIKPYSKAANLFNIHSWAPFHLQTDNREVGPGVSLFSQNTLSTAVTEIGYQFDLNEQTGTSSLKFEYLGWYPIISLELNTGLRRGETVLEEELYSLKWWQTDWNMGIRIPLNLTRNKWFRGVQPLVRYRQVYRQMDENVGLQFTQNMIHAFEYDLFTYTQLRSSRRDLYPRWGQIARVGYRHSAFDDVPANQFYASSSSYVPGLLRHHGIRLNAAYQKQQAGLWRFGNMVPVPRGYKGYYFDESVLLRADYVFPIIYPDINLPTVFLLQRIRAGFFADYMYGKRLQSDRELFSAGIELYSDWHFLNLPFPVSLGGRVSQAFLNNESIFEFLFSVNLNSLY
jgi:hypothetical protein